MLTHRNLMAMATLYLADVDALGPGDTHFHLAAQSHATGLFGLSHIAKATHQVLPTSGGFSPAEIADLLRVYANVSFFAPPTGLRRLLRDPAFRDARVDNIRTVLLGAAPVYAADLREGFAALGPRLWNGYGQGESPCTITAMSKALLAEAIASGDEARMVSVGPARTGVEVAIFDADDKPLPPGEVGEVVVRGDTVMAGYWRLPEASAAALRGGWLHTGDLGAMDARGFLTLLDRAKDLVISGGAEHLSARDRGRAARPSRRRRGGGDRRSRPRMGRERDGADRAARRRARRARTRSALPGAHRALQTPEALADS